MSTWEEIETLLGESQGIELKGEIVLKFKKPCVYIWFRGEETLYVGMSGNGLERMLKPGHDKFGEHGKDQILPTDHFIIWPVETVEWAEALERVAIRAFSPRYNETNGSLTRLVSKELGVTSNHAKRLIRELTCAERIRFGG